ncbi:MAG: NADH-quinone oxidoreductase subunit L [Thermoplasmata archaeon]|nr:NADH-quinone oxidoreductase subunit L [Thermoplasmata archaeon]
MTGPLSVLFGWAFLVPLAPTLAFVVIGLFGRRMQRLEWGGWVAVGGALFAMVLGVLIAVGEMLTPGSYTDRSFQWFTLAGSGTGAFPNGFSLVMGTLVDPLSAVMLIVVTVVGFLVMLFSIDYMHRDSGLPRYYAELSLFLASMLGLVLADNLLQFFLFWELVGVCSYFLIGFYYQRPAAASAAKEAFLVTRIGDVLFLLGIFIYFQQFATAGPALGWAAAGFPFVYHSAPFLAGIPISNPTLFTIAGLLILGGAAGKSAQFPLDVWLPDAMEGPTTVSALIHAATMVAAGVYLLAITSVFIGFSATDQLAIVAIGGFTTFWAATMALVNRDIKRVIAYSTVSQLGYMVLAVGAGFTMVGLYHLFTHAFFKALLFLAAGAVIHAIETQDLFKMGGLRKTMRVTSIGFLIGGLSLAGIPPLAGFFSKDDVLGGVYLAAQSHPLYWPFFALAFLTVFMTAYYIFRAWFLAFSGDQPRDSTLPQAHEPPWTMRLPILVLSALAVVAGLLAFVPQFGGLFAAGARFPPTPGVPPSYSATDLLLSGVSVGLGAGGILTAYTLWGNGRVFTLDARSAAQPIRRLLLERYYVKAGVDWFGLHAVYGLARLADFFDQYVIDGTVHGFERLFAEFSLRLRRIQSGVVLDYAAYVVAGLAVFLLFFFVIVPAIPALGGG